MLTKDVKNLIHHSRRWDEALEAFDHLSESYDTFTEDEALAIANEFCNAHDALKTCIQSRGAMPSMA